MQGPDCCPPYARQRPGVLGAWAVRAAMGKDAAATGKVAEVAEVAHAAAGAMGAREVEAMVVVVTAAVVTAAEVTVEGGMVAVPFAVDEVDERVTVGVHVQVVAPVVRSHRMVSVHTESIGAMQDAELAPAHDASVRIARDGGSYPGLDGIWRASER